MSLKRKSAIITGGSRGLGKGIAIELAKRGANILLTYHSSRTQAEQTVTEIQIPNGIEAKADNPEAPREVVKAAVDKWGCIDIIINNAGAREDYNFEDMT